MIIIPQLLQNMTYHVDKVLVPPGYNPDPYHLPYVYTKKWYSHHPVDTRDFLPLPACHKDFELSNTCTILVLQSSFDHTNSLKALTIIDLKRGTLYPFLESGRAISIAFSAAFLMLISSSLFPFKTASAS